MSERFEGAAAQEFARRELRQLMVNPVTWEVLWWRPDPPQLWLETFPRSGAHGGGPALLRLVSTDELEATSLRDDGWTVDDLDEAMTFLVDRWRRRGVLDSLPGVLGRWSGTRAEVHVDTLDEALRTVRSDPSGLTPLEDRVLRTAASLLTDEGQ